MAVSEIRESPALGQAQCPTSQQPETNRFLAALKLLKKQLSNYDGPERETYAHEFLEVLCDITRDQLETGVNAEHLKFEPAQFVQHLSWPALKGCDPKLDKSEIGRKVRPHRDKARDLFNKLSTGHTDLCEQAEVGAHLAMGIHSPGGGRPWQIWLDCAQQSADAATTKAGPPPGGVVIPPKNSRGYR